MPKNRKAFGGQLRWEELVTAFSRNAPHLAAWMRDEEEFAELRIKLRADSTCLAIAKGYGPDGGKVVCFGSGYGVEAAVMAVDATIQSGNWRIDKPYKPKS